MAENQIEPAATTRSPRRVRYLIDIVVLIALVFGLEAAAEAAYTPKSMQASFVYGGAVQMLEVVVAWVLIRLRGETLADIGLRRPGSWSRTFIVSILLAALIFAGIYFSEKAGFPIPMWHGSYRPVLPSDIPWIHAGYSEFPPELGNESKYPYCRDY